ncbi:MULTISPECIES: hypothetical protein [unclassified Nocardioides]|uniref:hypothetical protein n=1 Tax=unclassified Nocardioides TaxID=2615069 RepID=UPI003617655E
MLTLETTIALDGLSGDEFTDFMLTCDDTRYRAWWPGTHRQFHVRRAGPGEDHVGDVVWMDEYVGRRHLRMAAAVVDVVPGRRIVWQLRPWRLRPPVRLTLAFDPQEDGAVVRHVLTAGWAGWARVLDPVWRLYFSPTFAHDLDRHARTEFGRLPHLLHPDDDPTP